MTTSIESPQWQTRSPVRFRSEKRPATGDRGMVVTNHPLGSAAGAQMLARGGNAIDAAIAAVFALSVVEPAMVGPFGAGFINLHLASGESVVIDNYAVAPAAAHPDMFTPISDSWPWYMKAEGRANELGYLAVGVPGNLAAWCEVQARWGRLDLPTVMQPAIGFADHGFPATRYLVETISKSAADLAQYPASAEVFLPQGRVPKINEIILRRHFANSLRLIADGGADVLYRGALGEAIVRHIQEHGGLLSMEDLRAYRPVERQPVRGTYRGHEVITVPPTSAGGTHIVEMLNILEGFDVASLGFGTADGIHLLAEVMKIAFADRAAYMGDPDSEAPPVEWLTSKPYAEQRRNQIDMKRAGSYDAGSHPSGESMNTTHLSVADGEGNVVAMTQTINDTFGSKVTVPGTGILLNNNMALFDPHPGHPNSVAPKKRPVSSMSPTIVLRDGKPFMAIGTPGAKWIFTSVLQAILNVIDHGMTIQEAVEAPRVWTQGQELEVERPIPTAVVHALAQRGHIMCTAPRIAGGMCGILLNDDTGVMTGAACWRADGVPIGLSGGSARAGSGWGSLAG